MYCVFGRQLYGSGRGLRKYAWHMTVGRLTDVGGVYGGRLGS